MTHHDVAPPLHSWRTDRPSATARAPDARMNSMHKLRILILYPDPAGLALLTSMLKSLGYIIEEAANDRMAVRLMERDNIDLVLAGVDPGDGDALELLTYVRRKHRNVPVVLLFPRLHPERAKEALAAGGHGGAEVSGAGGGVACGGPAGAGAMRVADGRRAVERPDGDDAGRTGRDSRQPRPRYRRPRPTPAQGRPTAPALVAMPVAGLAPSLSLHGGTQRMAGMHEAMPSVAAVGERWPFTPRGQSGSSTRPARSRAGAHRQRPVAGGRSSSWRRRSPRHARRS